VLTAFIFCTLGEPQTLTVQVTPLRNLPLDLYILMDLSNSMSDELQIVKDIAGVISELWCIPSHTHPLNPHSHRFTITIHTQSLYGTEEDELVETVLPLL